MNKVGACFLLFSLVLFCISCGSSSRQLQSISISQTAVGTEVHFSAAGTFSAAPTNVTPLPVAWSNGLMAPPPPQYTYALSTEPYVVDCSANSGTKLQVSAYAPKDPGAPMTGTTKTVVVQSTGFTCP